MTWLPLLFLLTTAGDGMEPRFIALGDSITHGVRGNLKAEQTFVSLIHKALAKEGIRTVGINFGVGGERTDQADKRIGDVLRYKPKVVTIMYGTNDSYIDKGAKEPRVSPEYYRKNLTKLVTDLQKGGATPILMTPPRWGKGAANNGIGENPNVRLEAYVKVCREVAEATKAPLVDHFAHWTKAQEANTDIGAWTTDQCHPNARGHREMRDLILPVISRILKDEAK